MKLYAGNEKKKKCLAAGKTIHVSVNSKQEFITHFSQKNDLVY